MLITVPLARGSARARLVCQRIALVTLYRCTLAHLSLTRSPAPAQVRKCEYYPSAGRGCIGVRTGWLPTESNSYWWTEEPCNTQVQVNYDGRVAVLHPGGHSWRVVNVTAENWYVPPETTTMTRTHSMLRTPTTSCLDCAHTRSLLASHLLPSHLLLDGKCRYPRAAARWQVSSALGRRCISDH